MRRSDVMSLSLYTSRKISILSIIMAVLVVFIHAYTAGTPIGAESKVEWLVQDFISQGAARIAVPFFFIVFGYFLFSKYKAESGWFCVWKSVVLKRVKSLFVPYLLWANVGLAFGVVCSWFVCSLEESFDWSSIKWWLLALGLRFDVVIGPPVGMFHLWFVRIIFLATIVSPVLLWLYSKIAAWIVIAIAFLGIFVPGIPYWVVYGIFFIGVGYMFTQKSYSLKPSIAYGGGVIYLILLCGKSLLAYSGQCDIYGWVIIGNVKMNLMFATNVFGLTFIWFAYDVIAKLCDGSRICFMPEQYSGLSFFIYCSHYVILKAVSIGFKRIDYVATHQLFGYFARGILTVAICLLGYFTMAKWAPSFLGLLIGGRILKRYNGRLTRNSSIDGNKVTTTLVCAGGGG